MRAFTLNGTLGETTSSSTREVIARLATASGDLAHSQHAENILYASDPDGEPDTTLPLVIPMGQVVEASFVAVRVTNQARLAVTVLHEPDGGPEVEETSHYDLGSDAHPEGLLILFGGRVVGLEVTWASNLTVVESWVAG